MKTCLHYKTVLQNPKFTVLFKGLWCKIYPNTYCTLFLYGIATVLSFIVVYIIKKVFFIVYCFKLFSHFFVASSQCLI